LPALDSRALMFSSCTATNRRQHERTKEGRFVLESRGARASAMMC
jgi:hypothetical protein